ncbi:hypothetical protein BN77_2201 [Rhizobium mesoamericanum STM3625]|uniref:Uncharacterized protein n=1 Tax=Rhizobium mesoamericanum STM3625 TaxID=1211777 RepID=K0PM75_9HYPH|nr:hypothetical protein BN77_2201 [Rhizobium mesoamericanum STM3625]
MALRGREMSPPEYGGRHCMTRAYMQGIAWKKPQFPALLTQVLGIFSGGVDHSLSHILCARKIASRRCRKSRRSISGERDAAAG